MKKLYTLGCGLLFEDKLTSSSIGELDATSREVRLALQYQQSRNMKPLQTKKIKYILKIDEILERLQGIWRVERKMRG